MYHFQYLRVTRSFPNRCITVEYKKYIFSEECVYIYHATQLNEWDQIVWICCCYTKQLPKTSCNLKINYLNVSLQLASIHMQISIFIFKKKRKEEVYHHVISLIFLWMRKLKWAWPSCFRKRSWVLNTDRLSRSSLILQSPGIRKTTKINTVRRRVKSEKCSAPLHFPMQRQRDQ